MISMVKDVKAVAAKVVADGLCKQLAPNPKVIIDSNVMRALVSMEYAKLRTHRIEDLERKVYKILVGATEVYREVEKLDRTFANFEHVALWFYGKAGNRVKYNPEALAAEYISLFN